MFSRIKKSEILDLLIQNKRCVSGKLIFKVFKYICDFEKAEFEFNQEIKNKIKSTLDFLCKKWKMILKKQTAQKKFILLCNEQFVKFKVNFKNQTMELESEPLENLFNILNI